VNWCPQEVVLTAEARGGGRVPDAPWVELDHGEPVRGGADAVLALLRGAADQLPVHVRGVGRGHGDGQDVRREAVEEKIREAMGGEKGMEMQRRAGEW
jgi:hypothetical protein